MCYLKRNLIELTDPMPVAVGVVPVFPVAGSTEMGEIN